MTTGQTPPTAPSKKIFRVIITRIVICFVAIFILAPLIANIFPESKLLIGGIVLAVGILSLTGNLKLSFIKSKLLPVLCIICGCIIFLLGLPSPEELSSKKAQTTVHEKAELTKSQNDSINTMLEKIDSSVKAQANSQVLEKKDEAKAVPAISPTDSGIAVTAQQYKDKWPFTVPEGQLHCVNFQTRDGNTRPHVLFNVSGIDYALNGAARGTNRYKDSRDIMKKDKYGQLAIDSSDLIQLALPLCDAKKEEVKVIPPQNCGDEDQDQAKVMAEILVKNRLKSPDSAEFADWSIAKAERLDCGLWMVRSYVDAQNSFGAKLRSNFLVKIKRHWDNGWSLEEILMD